MSRIAVVDPATLLGQSVRDLLTAEPHAHEIRLLDNDAEAAGTLTQIGSEMALVHALDGESFADIDLAILCGGPQQQRAALAAIDQATPVILFDRGEETDGQRVVAGINDARAESARVVVSPHPGVVALAHLLSPFLSLGLRRVAATLLLPTSIHDKTGLDELFEQTRGILNFQGEMPTDVFAAQLAFNLLPAVGGTDIADQTVEILGADLVVSTQLAQAPVFHSLSASVHLELAEPIDGQSIHEALQQSSYLEIVEDDSTLGPIDAAAVDQILVGRIETAAKTPTATLWAVLDNLSRGGASNAVEIARRMLAGG